ncbi:hypothetical protein OUZ56_007234 [Daphnia magna]|uniref:Chromo domain-containing protein n=1 Tax=Daphnia magna TaxID=35525 RepID=A0ABQ9YY03_9CRUS|nr:hypothetical protein OUZ56_007234 [Daphnia magna]
MDLQKRVPKRNLPVPSPSPSPSPSPTRRPSTPLSPPVTPTSSIETDETRYHVQRILDEKFSYNHANQRIHEYFVKFRDYPSTENCFVHAEDLYKQINANCSTLFEKFNKFYQLLEGYTWIPLHDWNNTIP